MKMSCNTCQVKFTFFTRENGCPNCKFSYCTKCLKYKFSLPNIGTKKICGKCYFKLKDAEEAAASNQSCDLQSHLPEEFVSTEQMADQVAPIDITKKINALENPAKPPIVVYRQENKRWDTLKSGLDLVDQKMVDRLKKLKNEDKPIPQPSIEEIRRRLALLKDQDPDKPIPKINYHAVDTRTDEEKTADLINEYLEELELSSDVNADSVIQDRLAKLRGIDPAVFAKNEPTDDEEDEQTATKKIIKKALAEATIEAKYSESDLDELEQMDTESVDETPGEERLPWCVICNADAELRCLGCGGDLYCTTCFRDGHDSFEIVDHQSEPFKPEEKPESN